MSINEAKAYIEKLRTEYIENHKKAQERDELIGENAIEQRDVNGYQNQGKPRRNTALILSVSKIPDGEKQMMKKQIGTISLFWLLGFVGIMTSQLWGSISIKSWIPLA